MPEISLGKGITMQDGSLNVPVQVPDVPGGWHIVKAVRGDEVLVEAPYFVQRSLTDISPQRVKAGQTFTVRLRGIGWTDVDNGVAITYDNAYAGYAIGSSNHGDLAIDLVAAGGPGTHLVELYPMVYPGESVAASEDPFVGVPFLTALQDHPGQRLGYELSIIRLAIEAVE